MFRCFAQHNIHATFKDMDNIERHKAVALFETAARATTRHICDEALAKLFEAYPDVHAYVHNHALSTWASSYKTRADFKKVTSNIIGA